MSHKTKLCNALDSPWNTLRPLTCFLAILAPSLVTKAMAWQRPPFYTSLSVSQAYPRKSARLSTQINRMEFQVLCLRWWLESVIDPSATSEQILRNALRTERMLEPMFKCASRHSCSGTRVIDCRLWTTVRCYIMPPGTTPQLSTEPYADC